MITGNIDDRQLPMKKRAENILSMLRDRPYGIRRDFIDERMVKYLLRKELVEIIRKNNGGKAYYNMVVTKNLPKQVEPEKEDVANKTEKKTLQQELKELILQANEFYFEVKTKIEFHNGIVIFPGIYKGTKKENHTILVAASERVWGVTESGTVFYIKQRATNLRSNFPNKKDKKEFLWIKLQAKRIS